MSEKSFPDAVSSWNETKERIRAAAIKAGRNPANIRLMAVTKTVEPERINEVIHAGCDLLGENRVQEFLEKAESYDPAAEVHFIGRLQTNKVKYIADKVTMIESVDSVRLAREIDRRCASIGKIMDVLLEVNIADEENKGGFQYEEIWNVLEIIDGFSHLRVRGLMTIGRLGADFEEIKQYFRKMHQLFVDIKSKKLDNRYIDILSMGMSSDYELAVA